MDSIVALRDLSPSCKNFRGVSCHIHSIIITNISLHGLHWGGPTTLSANFASIPTPIPTIFFCPFPLILVVMSHHPHLNVYIELSSFSFKEIYVTRPLKSIRGCGLVVISIDKRDNVTISSITSSLSLSSFFFFRYVNYKFF